MANEKTPETKPFPGSPTGNQSGAGGTRHEQVKGKTPTEPYPGSPTGNASGAGDTPEADDRS